MRAIQRDLSPWLAASLGHAALRKPAHKQVKKAFRAASSYKPREAFAPEQWPERLVREVKGYESYRTNEFHDGPGLERRNVAIKLVEPITFTADRRRLNQYVRFILTSEGLSDPSLLDLVNADRYRRFLRWYLGDHTNGGHRHAMNTGIALFLIGRYLTATGAYGDNYQYAPDSRHPDAPWNRIERLAMETFELAGKRGQLRRNNKVSPESGVTPRRLLEIGERGFNTPPLSSNGATARAEMILLRQRSATAAILLACLPVHLRNIVEMQRGLNLFRDARGNYFLRYEGEQWKVAVVNGETFQYNLPLPKAAARALERWFAVLENYALRKHGIDAATFRQRVPYVFPQYHIKGKPKAWGRCNEKSMRAGIESLTLEVGGIMLRPHDFRRIVATSAAEKGTLEDAELAATLLGNKRETVLATYFRADRRKLVERYFAQLGTD